MYTSMVFHAVTLVMYLYGECSSVYIHVGQQSQFFTLWGKVKHGFLSSFLPSVCWLCVPKVVLHLSALNAIACRRSWASLCKDW